MNSVFIAIAVLLVASAQAVRFDRPCRLAEMSPRVKQNFNVGAYTGLWYEIKSYTTQGQLPLDCVEARYSALPDGGVEVLNTGWSTSGRQVRLTGRADLSQEGISTNRAKLEVLFLLQGRTPSIYWVMGTDYTNYAVVWSCANLPLNNSQETFWVLSRTTNPSPSTQANIDRVLAENDAVLDALRVNNQDINFCMSDRS